MNVGLRKAPCVSYFRVSIIDYYLVCILQIHKICALCGILIGAISVLLTTENFHDLEIRVQYESRSLKVTPVNSSCVISYQSLIVPEAVFPVYKI